MGTRNLHCTHTRHSLQMVNIAAHAHLSTKSYSFHGWFHYIYPASPDLALGNERVQGKKKEGRGGGEYGGMRIP